MGFCVGMNGLVDPLLPDVRADDGVGVGVDSVVI